MIETLLSFYAKLMELGKVNPVMSGVVALWAAAVGTYLMRNIPVAVKTWLMRRLTTTITINNHSGQWQSKNSYNAFMFWWASTRYAAWTRNYGATTREFRTGGMVYDLEPGYGFHYLFYRGRFGWFRRIRVDSNGVDYQKEEITITLFTRDVELLRELYMTNAEAFHNRDGCRGWTWNSRGFSGGNGEWEQPVKLLPRPVESVITEGDVVQTLIQAIRDFRNNREWYLKHGIPYKLAICLYGPPGTGKTSIIRAVQSYFNADLYQIPLSSISDTGLSACLASIPTKGFGLAEDFDDLKSLHRVKTEEQEQELDPNDPQLNEKLAIRKNKKAIESIDKQTGGRVTRTGFLNAVDGAIPLDETIMFFTTNHLDLIDEAVIRDGRFDKLIYVGYLSDASIRRYARAMYGDDVVFPEGVRFTHTAGSKLYTHFNRNKQSAEGFIKEIVEAYATTVETQE